MLVGYDRRSSFHPLILVVVLCPPRMSALTFFRTNLLLSCPCTRSYGVVFFVFLGNEPHMYIIAVRAIFSFNFGFGAVPFLVPDENLVFLFFTSPSSAIFF